MLSAPAIILITSEAFKLFTDPELDAKVQRCRAVPGPPCGSRVPGSDFEGDGPAMRWNVRLVTVLTATCLISPAMATISMTAAQAAEAISVSPNRGAVGTAVAIEGSGWDAETALNVVWNCGWGNTDRRSIANVTADGTGDWSASSTVPANCITQGSEVWVEAYGGPHGSPSGVFQVTDGGSQPSCATPEITLSASSGKAGDNVKVSGEGWTRGGAIQLTATGPATWDMGSVPVSEAGTFDSSFPIGSGTTGDYTLTFSESHGGCDQRVDKKFTVTPTSPNATFLVPFKGTEPWYICRGYNTVTHNGKSRYALDLVKDKPASSSGVGCTSNNTSASADESVVAPVSGQAWDCFRHAEFVCITSNQDETKGFVFVLGHMVASSRTLDKPVTAGQEIGRLRAPADPEKEIAHIHFEIRPKGAGNASVPFLPGHATQFCGNEFPDSKIVGEHHGKTVHPCA